MKRTKIIILAITTIMLFCLSGCNLENQVNDQTEKEIVMTVNCDYRFHMNGKVVPLLDSNRVFFDLEEYNIPQLYPGDKVVVTYTGEMMIAESYPGQVITNGIDIIDIVYQPAEIILIEEENIIRDENNQIKLISNYTQHEYIILDKEMNFCKLSEYNGEKVYATTNSDDYKLLTKDPVILTYGLLAFNPYE